jgi:hypothetical protein
MDAQSEIRRPILNFSTKRAFWEGPMHALGPRSPESPTVGTGGNFALVVYSI